MPRKRSSTSTEDSKDVKSSPQRKSSKKTKKLTESFKPESANSKMCATEAQEHKQRVKEISKEASSKLSQTTVVIDTKQQRMLNEQLFSVVKLTSFEAIKERIEELVKKGADVNAMDQAGNPFIFKVLHGCHSAKTLELVLSLGANPNCINAKGRTFLQDAAIATLGDDRIERLKVILEGGTDVNFVNEDDCKCPALWTIITNGEDKQVDLFLEHGADVTTLDEDGKSILSFLSELDTDRVPLKQCMLDSFIVRYTRIFKSRGAKLSPADIGQEEYHNPLKKYLECGGSREAREFVKRYKKGYRGVKNPLHVAAMNSDSSCLKCLLASGLFDVNEKDSSGDTPLLDAAYCENEKNLRLLLEHGADPNATDSRGESAFGRAKEEKFHEHMRLLVSYGAKRPVRDSDDSDDSDDFDDYRRSNDCVIS